MNCWQDFEHFVRRDVSLAHMTTYRVGGPAEFFAEPPDAPSLGELLRRAAAENIPVKMLGRGSNLLIADKGVRGLVIHLPKAGFSGCIRENGCVQVGAAHSLPRLVKWSANEGLRGLECLFGVPGTVGAAVRMNAGGKYGEIGPAIRRVRGFELDGTPFDLAAAECRFEYRNSNLRRRIVTEGELRLAPGDPVVTNYLMNLIFQEKARTQPLRARSAGCAFKNPKIAGLPPAGRMIEAAGLKGFRLGGAVISELHANFLLCDGEATARELAELIKIVRRRVFAEFGVMLELEVEVWGFDPEELLPQNSSEAA